MSSDTTVSTLTAPTDAIELDSAVADVATDAVLVEDELLVEEISIDGMCGVY